jgi:hypothetical protein
MFDHTSAGMAQSKQRSPLWFVVVAFSVKHFVVRVSRGWDIERFSAVQTLRPAGTVATTYTFLLDTAASRVLACLAVDAPPTVSARPEK